MPKYIIKMRLIIFLIFLAIIVSSCENGVDDPKQMTEPSEKKSIAFRITWTDYSGRGEAIQKIVDAYNAQSDSQYEIDMVSGNEALNEVESILRTPDQNTILALPYRYVRYFGENEALSDLTTAFEADAALFYPELYNLGTVDDAVYGIPWVGHSICLIYNADLLKEAGVEPESITDLDALAAALAKVEEKTNAKGIGLVGAAHNDISWMINQFIYGFGSRLVDETGQKVAINNQNSVSAIEYYRDTLGKYAQDSWLTDSGVEVMNAFRNGDVAFEFQGVWGLTDIEQNGNPFEVGLITLDKIGLVSEVGPIMLALPNGMSEEVKAEGIKFIQYMISIDAQKMVMNGEYSPEHDKYYPFRVPTRMDMAESLIASNYEAYLPFIAGFEHPSIDVPVPKWQSVKEQYYEKGLHDVMTQAITIEAFLAEVERLGNDILKQE